MFQIGMEFDFTRQLKGQGYTFILISATGIIVPFLLGVVTAPFFWESLPEPRPDILGFRLFFAVAMSITAIPILGRIFMELNYSDTKIASIIISSAAIDDVIGWLLLGLITALVTASFNEQIMLYKICSLILFALIAYFLGSRVLSSFINKMSDQSGKINSIFK